MRLAAVALVAMLPLLASVNGVNPGKMAGNSEAPITVEIFSEFQSPACKEFHDRNLPVLMREFVASGKVKLIYRDIAQTNHPYAHEAATYAGAAARLGLYREVADELFRVQTAWMVSGDVWTWVSGVLSPDQRTKLRAIAASGEVSPEIQHAVDAAGGYGVTTTPMLVISQGSRFYLMDATFNYILLEKFLNDLVK